LGKYERNSNILVEIGIEELKHHNHILEMSSNSRLLARLPTITFLSNIADTFGIHAPYLIVESGVKLKS